MLPYLRRRVGARCMIGSFRRRYRAKEDWDMTIAKKTSVLFLAVAVAGLIGCAPKMTREQLRDMKPQRPAELERLNVFVGNWKSTGECTMAGLDDTLRGTGTSTFSWDLDNFALVEKGTHEMEELGAMQAMGVWTWDARKERYHMSWTDSWGGHGEGWSRVSDDGKWWKMTAKSHSPMGTTTGKGTMEFIDNDTVKWTWTESVFLGMMKVFEMEGTMTRQ
jgi:hypothetical protein